MLIIAIILLGILAGLVGRWVVERFSPVSFAISEAFIAGLAGSFVGGLLFNLIAGNGFDVSASGIVGSSLGAIVILAVWSLVRVKRRTP